MPLTLDHYDNPKLANDQSANVIISQHPVTAKTDLTNPYK